MVFALEIALRTTVMYLYTLALVRLLGKRGMAQLSPFEMVIIVALGSAIGDPMFYADVPLIHGIIVVTVVVGLERLIVRLTENNQWLERVVESTPVLLVADGEIVRAALDDEDLSEAELFMALRQNGIEQLGEVRLAYLEPNGHLS
ncbi:MAG TPA: YetF domain-containing protein, partial [Acidimicrobiia bacterium]|nr:YetF domain-containing protein [Acidimicrobiia bacterium]